MSSSVKKVLVVHYSQTGQLSRAAEKLVNPLLKADDIDVVFECVRPLHDYPFPWPFFRFLDTFPEAVYQDAPALEKSALRGDEDFDLIVLAYQVWFLSPSLPISAFLQSELAEKLFAGKPVVTLVACRNMWLMAQEDIRQALSDLRARLVGHIALVDEAGSIGSFLATPLWVLSGKQGPFLNGLIPRAGVSESDMNKCPDYGVRLLEKLRDNELDANVFAGLQTAVVNEKLISSEKTGKRAFRLWGKLFRLLGPAGSIQRKPLVLVYVVFLVTLIVTVVPLNIAIKSLLAPFTKKKIAQQKAYFGEDAASPFTE